MNRIDRLTAILIHLQSRRIVKAKDLADRFEISLRTVYRDIRALEEAGVPIGAEAGVGYYIMEGYHIPPIMFTKSEAGALLTGEKLIEQLGDRSISQEFSNAMRKIRAVMKSSDKDYLESLEEGIVVYKFKPKLPEQFPNHYLTIIQDALALRKLIEIEYFSYYNDQVTNRKVEAIGVSYINNGWHLIGYCRLRNDYRDFRIDRIKNLKLMEEKFEKRDAEPFHEYIKKFTTPQTTEKLMVRFESQTAKYMFEQKFYYGLVEEKKVGNKVEMTFLNSCMDYFARWLLLWGNSVEILSPPELKEKMRDLSKEIHQHYVNNG